MSLELIKKLREETSAGMLECKNALEKAHGNYDEALKIIQSTIQKPSESKRVASKGLCHVVTYKNEAILFEVNAETDFVSKNEHFKKLIVELGEVLIHSKANYPKEALNVTIGNKTVNEAIIYTSGIIKENAYLRRFFRIKKKDEQSFGTYVHQGGKVVTLVILNTKHEELAKDLAMQVAANPPTYLSLDTIDSQTRLYEKMMLEKNNQEIDDKALESYLKTLTLYDQAFIKESTMTVNDMLENNLSEVVDFFRFELGQGIEDKLSCKLTLPCDGSVIEIK